MGILTATRNLLADAALALVYPRSCQVCGAAVEESDDGVACAACWTETELFDGRETLCDKCGALVRALPAPTRSDPVRCGDCDRDVFTAARACGTYHGALRATVLNLKREPWIARRALQLMAAAISRPPLTRATLIVPIPLQRDRERERGFNQASILSWALARVCDLPVDAESLVRAKATGLHRVGMDARARRESVEQAFIVRRSGALEGESILLIDDVFTTGATISACARVLMEAGADEVLALTLARRGSV